MASAAGLHQRKQTYSHPEIQPAEESDGEQQAAAAAPAAAAVTAGQQRPRPTSKVPAWLKGAGIAASLLVAITALYLMLTFPEQSPAKGLLRPEQLRRYDGRGWRQRRVYLAVMGEVFDVTDGARHYGPGGGYSFFAGRDASRAFVTGKFQEDLTDDVADFDQERFEELVNWRDFYVKHKKYTPVGKVVGRFYDSEGNPTSLQQRAEAEAAAGAAAKQQAQAAAGDGGGTQEQPGGTGVETKPHLPCNVKWSKVEGGSVWCPDGKFPRRVMQADWQGQPQEQCVCVEAAEPSGTQRLYDGCSAEATQCQTSPPEGNQ